MPYQIISTHTETETIVKDGIVTIHAAEAAKRAYESNPAHTCEIEEYDE